MLSSVKNQYQQKKHAFSQLSLVCLFLIPDELDIRHPLPASVGNLLYIARQNEHEQKSEINPQDTLHVCLSKGHQIQLSK